MQEVKERRRTVVPSFGDWDSCDDSQITRYFESARQAGLLRGHSFRREEADLFRVFPPSPLLYYHYDYGKPRKVVTERKQQKQCRHQVAVGKVKQQGKQTRVCDVIGRPAFAERRGRAPRAVDEDLYKIPPELLYQKPKSRAMLRDLWKRCMSLNCVP